VPRRRRKPKRSAKAEEARAHFFERVPLTDEEASALEGRAQTRAFWLAGIADLRLVDEVLRSLERSSRLGEDFKTWQRRIGPSIRAAWGPGRRDRAGRVFDQGHRLRTIFANAVSAAENEGRRAILSTPQVRAIRPFWEFVNPAPVTSICQSLVGTILPADDPFWTTRQPPLHHACKSRIRSLTRKQATKRGMTTQPPPTRGDPGFGVTPDARMTDLVRVNLENVDPELRSLFETKTREL